MASRIARILLQPRQITPVRGQTVNRAGSGLSNISPHWVSRMMVPSSPTPVAMIALPAAMQL